MRVLQLLNHFQYIHLRKLHGKVYLMKEEWSCHLKDLDL